MNVVVKLLIFVLIGCSLFNAFSLLRVVFSSHPTSTSPSAARFLEPDAGYSVAARATSTEAPSTQPAVLGRIVLESNETEADSENETQADPSSLNTSGHRLAVVVPFREAFKELYNFVPHMHEHLTNQGINFTIFVVNQMDHLRFNRGALLNAGVAEIGPGYDYVALHDVDLLPLRAEINYHYPSRPLHLCPHTLHPKYHFRKYSGGIVLLPVELFRRVNGFSSAYWGWGKEDLDFAQRLKDAGTPLRPLSVPGRKRIKQAFFRHLHDEEERERDKGRRPAFRAIVPHAFGLNNTQYRVHSRETLIVERFPYVRINVKLACNLKPKRLCMD